jgi:hypothetical protein
MGEVLVMNHGAVLGRVPFPKPGGCVGIPAPHNCNAVHNYIGSYRMKWKLPIRPLNTMCTIPVPALKFGFPASHTNKFQPLNPQFLRLTYTTYSHLFGPAILIALIIQVIVSRSPSLSFHLGLHPNFALRKDSTTAIHKFSSLSIRTAFEL